MFQDHTARVYSLRKKRLTQKALMSRISIQKLRLREVSWIKSQGLWVELCPPPRYVEALTQPLRPVNMILFGNTVFVDAIEFNEVMLDLGSPNPMAGVLRNKGKFRHKDESKTVL